METLETKGGRGLVASYKDEVEEMGANCSIQRERERRVLDGEVKETAGDRTIWVLRDLRRRSGRNGRKLFDMKREREASFVMVASVRWKK